MNNKLYYKGYTAEVYYCAEDNLIYGRLTGIKDLINFHSDNTNDIVQHFHNAVDDYIDLCNEIEKKPDVPDDIHSYEPKSAEQYLELLCDIAYDYDGFNTVASLKALIDELKNYAHKAWTFLYEGNVFDVRRKPTYFKRVKNMSIEEMAMFLMKVNNAYAMDCMCGMSECKHPDIDANCAICFKEYLESEAKEE